jgi:hypothetical protein
VTGRTVALRATPLHTQRALTRHPTVVMDFRDPVALVVDDEHGHPALQLTDGVAMVSLEPGPGPTVAALLGAERLLTEVQRVVDELRAEISQRAART